MKIANNAIDKYVKNISNEKIAGAVVFGKDVSVIKSRVGAIAKSIVSDLSDQFLVCDLSKERLSKDKSCLAGEFYAFSMFGGRKLITIKDCDTQAGAALKEFLKDGENVQKSDNFILVQAGDLDAGNSLRKTAQNSEFIAAIPCYEDSDEVTRKLITQLLKRNNIVASYEQLDLLQSLLGKNRQIIASEIDKLATFLDGKELQNSDIEKVIKSQSEVAFEEFVEHFANQDLAKATVAISGLINGGFEPIMAVRFLSNHVQKLYHAKNMIEHEGASIEQATQSQRLFFKAQYAFKNQLRKVKIEQVKKWLKEIEQLEIALKSQIPSSTEAVFVSFLNKVI